MSVLDRLRSSRLYKRASRALLEIDAFFDSSMFESGERSRSSYASLIAFMDRLHVSGGRRLLVEAFCEGSNIAVVIGLIALFFAHPGF